MLGELHNCRRCEEQQRTCGPAVEDDRRDGEDERQRKDTAAVRADRHREPLCERGRSRQGGEPDQLTPAVRCRPKLIRGRDQHAEARDADGEDQSGEPAGRCRRGSHTTATRSAVRCRPR